MNFGRGNIMYLNYPNRPMTKPPIFIIPDPLSKESYLRCRFTPHLWRFTQKSLQKLCSFAEKSLSCAQI